MGAGDGFISGFLMAALEGRTLASAMSKGAKFAAQACSWQGGFGYGVPWIGDAEAVRAIAAR
jgi:fructoselysine 6-kinase